MKLSFVIPSHNCSTWLPHAVRSCLEQTHKDIEVIIVDDGSTDLTRQYLDFIQSDERVRILTNPTKQGRSKSRNMGNEAAKGEVICVLDADDIAEPNRARFVADKFQGGGVQFAFGSGRVIDPDGTVLREIRSKPFDFKDAMENMTNGIIHSTVAYTKEFAEKYPYSEGDICRLGIEDWDQQLRAVRDGVKLTAMPQFLSSYRLLDSGTVRNRDEEEVKRVKESVLVALEIPAVASVC